MKADPVGPGQEVTLEVHGISSTGAGVGRLPDGRVAFIHGTGPGERIRAEIDRVKKRWVSGRLLEVVTPGPYRRPPPCPFQGKCGGCPLEHLTYEGQLKAKEGRIRDALERIGGLSDLPGFQIHPSPRELRYRNRVTFTLLRLQGPDRIVAGFHALDDPGRVMDVDGRCLLPEEVIGQVWAGLREAWGPGASRLPAGRRLRLTLRATRDGEVLLLVEGGRGTGVPEELLQALPALVAIWHRQTPSSELELLGGEPELEEVWFGEEVAVRPDAFLQVNRDGAEELHALALREMGAPRGRRVIDAYCGMGVYGRRLCRHGAQVVGIELDPGAVAMAREGAPQGFSVLEGRVEDCLAEVLPADLVILNPPRAGTDPAVMHALSDSQVPRIVYVSCDPATLARDLARLGSNYDLTRIQAFDLFPQTAHVETVVTLDRS